MDVSRLKRQQPRMTIVAAALATALSAGAFAQQDSTRENANRQNTEIARSDTGMQTLEQYLQRNSLRVSNLIGMEVQNRSGDNLGEVEDVLRGAGAGQDMQLIVHTGGIGAEDRLVAIAFDEIQINADGDELYTNRTREQLAAAPAVELEARGNIARLAQRSSDAADRRTTTAERDVDRAVDRDAANRSPGQQPGAAAGGARTTQPGAAGGAAAQAGAGSMEQRRLGDLVGAEVVGSDGESIGEVDDIVLSTAGADSLRAVLQVGGLAGIGEKRVALPLGQITVDRSDDEPTLRVAMDQDALERLPEFDYEEDTEAL